MTTALENAPTGATEDAGNDMTTLGENADKGKLFEVPRVKVIADTSDPTVLKIAFSGSIELDRTKADDVEFYNKLKAGKRANLDIEVHVAGPTTRHRRDSEGDVDAVVQTKSLVVTGAALQTD